MAAGGADPNAPAPAPPAKPLALIGATIRTGAGEMVGNIVVDHGKIVAIGADAAVPADAKRVTLTGHIITPGLIDARSVSWLNSGAAREGGRDGSLNILDGVDPFDDGWKDAAAQGVTAVYIQPASTGSLGGSGAVLRVAPATKVEDLVVRSPAAVQASLGVTAAPPPAQANPLAALFAQLGLPVPPTQTAPPAPTLNALTRYAQYESLKGQLDGAKKSAESKTAKPDPAKELLLKVVRRELPLRLEIGNEDDLRNAARLASESGVRLIIDRMDRARAIPDEFTTAKSSMVVTGKATTAIKQLALDGRKWAIGTGGDEPRATAWLRARAAALVAEGMPRDKVLHALTRDAAETLGVGDQLGLLAVGRVADLAVFAGEPLDPSVPVRMTICQGVVTFEQPGAEVVPIIAAAKPELPDHLPAGYVIKTKRLLQPTGEFAPGEVYIEGGKVTARPPNGGAATFDVGDAPVTPGLIAGCVTLDGELDPDADAAHLRAADGMAADDKRLRGLRDGGFLTVVLAPGSENVIAGMTGAVRSADPAVARDCGMKFVLSSAARNADRFPISLIGQTQLVGDRLRGQTPKTELYLPDAVQKALLAERDRGLEALRGRKSAAWFDTQTRGEVRAALRLIAEHKLRGVIAGPRQVEDMTDEIRASGVAVVAGPARSGDPEKVRTGLVALGRAGVALAYAGTEPTDIRQTAAWLANGGLARPLARRGLIASAEPFNLPPGTARLAAGDPADAVIWDGDPLDPASRALAVIAAGHRIRIESTP